MGSVLSLSSSSNEHGLPDVANCGRLGCGKEFNPITARGKKNCYYHKKACTITVRKGGIKKKEEVFAYYWCCGATQPNARGCKVGYHEAHVEDTHDHDSKRNRDTIQSAADTLKLQTMSQDQKTDALKRVPTFMRDKDESRNPSKTSILLPNTPQGPNIEATEISMEPDSRYMEKTSKDNNEANPSMRPGAGPENENEEGFGFHPSPAPIKKTSSHATDQDLEASHSLDKTGVRVGNWLSNEEKRLSGPFSTPLTPTSLQDSDTASNAYFEVNTSSPRQMSGGPSVTNDQGTTLHLTIPMLQDGQCGFDVARLDSVEASTLPTGYSPGLYITSVARMDGAVLVNDKVLMIGGFDAEHMEEDQARALMLPDPQGNLDITVYRAQLIVQMPAAILL